MGWPRRRMPLGRRVRVAGWDVRLRRRDPWCIYFIVSFDSFACLLACPFSSFIYFAVVVSVMMVLLWRRQRKLVSTGVESACSSTFTSCRHPIFLLLARARCGRSVFSTIVQ